MDLALKADAFFVTTESDKAASSAATTADASRLRLVLEGGRSFDAGGGATVRPSLELGVRHDGGDAETGFRSGARRRGRLHRPVHGSRPGGEGADAPRARGLGLRGVGRERDGAARPGRARPGALVQPRAHHRRHVERVGAAVGRAGRAGARTGRRRVRGGARPASGGRLRHGAVRRPLHGHAEPRASASPTAARGTGASAGG